MTDFFFVFLGHMMHMCGCLLLQYGPYGVCLKNLDITASF